MTLSSQAPTGPGPAGRPWLPRGAPADTAGLPPIVDPGGDTIPDCIEGVDDGCGRPVGTGAGGHRAPTVAGPDTPRGGAVDAARRRLNVPLRTLSAGYALVRAVRCHALCGYAAS